MSKSRIAAGVVAMIVCIGLFYLWLSYSVKRSLDKAFGPAFERDMQDLGVAIKGGLGEAIFERGAILPKQENTGSTTGADGAKDVLARFRKDPEKYKKYAKLLDTSWHAAAVGDAALKILPPERMPVSSTELVSIKADKRIDAWGHPFCIISTRDRLVVVSGGPEALSPISCQKPNIKLSEILQSPRNLFKAPSGEVVLILDRHSSKRAVEQALEVAAPRPN
jgi:hypothetical protein